MSGRRTMRHVQVDVGDGITAMVKLRGPMTPELEEAFRDLARAAIEDVRASGETQAEAIRRVRRKAGLE